MLINEHRISNNKSGKYIFHDISGCGLGGRFFPKIYRDIIINSLNYCRAEKGMQLWAYVIMTNHVHCILSAKFHNLSDLVRDFKRFTSTHILRTILESEAESRKNWMLKRFEFAAKRNKRNNKYQLWTHENHAIEIVSQKILMQKMAYIHNNPVKARWVEKAEDWIYSSQRNYSNIQAIIEIDIADL